MHRIVPHNYLVLREARATRPGAGLSLFAAAFDLRWLTCLSSGNGYLSGISKDHVQITYVSLMSDSDVAVEEIARLVGHASSKGTETVCRHQLRPVMTTGEERWTRSWAPSASAPHARTVLARMFGCIGAGGTGR